MDAGGFRQCRHTARPGFRTCGVHGAGYPKREREGKAKNPAASSLVAGGAAKPETVSILLENHPELAPLYRRYLDESDLLDLRPQLAAAKTLVDHYLRLADLAKAEGSFGTNPPVLRAIDALETTVRLAERLLAVEQKLGPVTRAELQRMTYAFAVTLARYVPTKKLEEAKAFCRAQYFGAGLGPGTGDSEGAE